MMDNDSQIVSRKSLDLPALRDRLASATGKQYWRGLEEIAGTEEFQDMLHREYPDGAGEWSDPVSRRNFLKLMGASLALAGVGACTRQPDEVIVPYVKAPEQFVPGVPTFYATAMPLRGYAIGVLAESHMGRPIKLEGNPDHPASLGATDSITQASILGLYDPDRSQTVVYRANIGTWEKFLGALTSEIGAWNGTQGRGVRILTETISSPTLADQLRRFLAKYPAARWHQFDPASRTNVREGARLAFGEYIETIYRFSEADVILSLDGDFLDSMPASVRYAREFIDGRRVSAGVDSMNRLYVLESSPTLTGGMADHRLALPPSRLEEMAWAIATGVGVSGGPGGGDLDQKWIAAVVRDLQAHRGRSLVVAGEHASPAIHALAHAMNEALGNVGSTVVYTDPVDPNPVDHFASIAELARDMEAGVVDTLIVLGGNPVFTAPADLAFADKMAKVRLRIHLGLYQDETAYLSHWHIPEAHFLESWSDARAFDGTLSLIQPLVAPLYEGKSAHEVLAAMLGDTARSTYDIVRGYWQTGTTGTDSGSSGAIGTSTGMAPATAAADTAAAQAGPGEPVMAGMPLAPAGSASRPAAVTWEGGFEKGWQRALYFGLVRNTAFPARNVAVRSGWAAEARSAATTSAAPGSVELVFRLDPHVLDGRFANNGWLQELSRPLTKLSWDNPLLIGPAMAERLGVETEDVVEVTHDGRKISLPVWVMPGHPDGVATVHLGYGRTRAGQVGNNTGFNTFAIWTSGAPWHAAGAEIRPTGDTHPLASVQTHHSMEGRDLIRETTFAEYKADPNSVRIPIDTMQLPTLYPEYKYEGYAWGMAIDLNACIGCNACSIACQAENNIPVVGKEQVRNSREMHWIRVDRYYAGDLETPEVYHQPRPCMHCEKAPCEPVCPVGATVHSDEGLNDMVYNRCVGTRYCSNNCPYKVRRFNYLQYTDHTSPSLKLMRNPDVTVRSRGVMEKCTYCVQRINSARINAKKADRAIQDGEITPACAQVCPTGGIIFGDINDPNSRVAKLKMLPLNYALLQELGTQPRTTYLAKLRNPNPEIEGAA